MSAAAVPSGEGLGGLDSASLSETKTILYRYPGAQRATVMRQPTAKIRARKTDPFEVDPERCSKANLQSRQRRAKDYAVANVLATSAVLTISGEEPTSEVLVSWFRSFAAQLRRNEFEGRFPYLRAIHRSARLHVHVMLPGRLGRDVLQRHWPHGRVHVAHLAGADAARNMASYITGEQPAQPDDERWVQTARGFKPERVRTEVDSHGAGVAEAIAAMGSTFPVRHFGSSYGTTTMEWDADFCAPAPDEP